MEISRVEHDVRVIHVRDSKEFEDNGWNVVYIGRPSIYGNPFMIGKDGSRDEVIEKFEEYLAANVKEDTSMYTWLVRLQLCYEAGEKIALACYCTPKRCHGDVLARFIAGITREEVDALNEAYEEENA